MLTHCRPGLNRLTGKVLSVMSGLKLLFTITALGGVLTETTFKARLLEPEASMQGQPSLLPDLRVYT